MAQALTARATPTSPAWLSAAVLLTLVDAVATAVWLELGVASEANPLLARLADTAGAVPAMAVRAAVGIGLLAALAALAPRSVLARRALPVLTAVLGAVVVWHVVGALGVVA